MARGLPGFAAVLGDGDDRIAIAGDLRVETTISGGDGKDVIEGGAGNDAIDGGPAMTGCSAAAGPTSSPTRPARSRSTVDLARETGGEAGETDGVGGFEVLAGGSGDDALRGGSGDREDRRRRRRRRPARARRPGRAVRRQRRGPRCTARPAATASTATRGRATATTRRSSGCSLIVSTAARATTGSSTPADGTRTWAGPGLTCSRAARRGPDGRRGRPGPGARAGRRARPRRCGSGRDARGPTAATLAARASAGERQLRLGREAVDRPVRAKWSKLTPRIACKLAPPAGFDATGGHPHHPHLAPVTGARQRRQ